jgi:DNA-binding transcriptional ArsR family regulator
MGKGSGQCTGRSSLPLGTITIGKLDPLPALNHTEQAIIQHSFKRGNPRKWQQLSELLPFPKSFTAQDHQSGRDEMHKYLEGLITAGYVETSTQIHTRQRMDYYLTAPGYQYRASIIANCPPDQWPQMNLQERLLIQLVSPVFHNAQALAPFFETSPQAVTSSLKKLREAGLVAKKIMKSNNGAPTQGFRLTEQGRALQKAL